MTPFLLLNVARPWGETDPVTLASTAVAAGMDGVGLADSPRLFPDPLVSTERVLRDTEARLAGPCVLSLGLRHPATVAGALRTLAQSRPGRVVAVVGRGESSVRNAGVPVPSLRAYEESMACLVDLLAEDGAGVRLLGAASGPRTIAVTASRLPGVLVDAGADPATIGRAVGVARAARPDAEVWLFVRAVVTSSQEEAHAAALPVLGSCAARLAAAPDWFGLDSAEHAVAQQLAAAHDYRRHGTAQARPDASLLDADQLVLRRFVVTGSPHEIESQVSQVAHLGVRGVVLAGALTGVVERLGELSSAVRAGLST